MAVVDLAKTVEELFQSQALGLKAKIDTATAQAKGTAIKGVIGYYVATGLVTAGMFCFVVGLGLILGHTFGDSQLFQGVGLLGVGGSIVGILLLSAFLMGKPPKPGLKQP